MAPTNFRLWMFQSEKLQRKQAKREKLERQATECRRLKELLQLQNLLDSLGSETARSDFMSGNNGAVVSIKFVNVTTRIVMSVRVTHQSKMCHFSLKLIMSSLL